MDKNIINYLNQKNTLKKSVKSKPTRRVYKKPVRRKIRWGSKIGGKGARDYSRKDYTNRRTQNDPIDRLLTLMASSLMLNQQSSQDKERVKQIDSDRGIAQVLQQEEILQPKKGEPKTEEPKMGEPSESEKRQVMGEFQAYTHEFNRIEDSLNEIENELNTIPSISTVSANDFREKLTALNQQKLELQDNLNTQLKDKQNVWTWRAVLEQSGDDLNALVRKETEVNTLLFDKLDKQLLKQEQELQQQKNILEENKETFGQIQDFQQAELFKIERDLNEKIKQIGEAKQLQEDLLFKTEREKADLETNISLHENFIKEFEAERDKVFMSQQETIQDLERKNELLLREKEGTGTAAGLTDIEVMEQYIAGKIESAGKGEVQTAIDRLGIRAPKGIPQKQAREYYRNKVEQIKKDKDKASLIPFVSSVPKPTLLKSLALVPDTSVESFASMGSVDSATSDRSDKVVREQTASEARMFATSNLGSGTPTTAKQRLEEALARKPKSFEPTGADIKQISAIVRQKAGKDLEEIGLPK
tara:strand:+ start:2304 stop:3896 length:1593 start_codon:yes stop_codon:yes gene_type:complete